MSDFEEKDLEKEENDTEIEEVKEEREDKEAGQEETGYGGGEWRLLAKIAPNPGAMNNLCYCFVAEGVEKISDQHLEKTEDIAVHLMSEKEVKREMTNGGFMQALMLAPLYKYMYESR